MHRLEPVAVCGRVRADTSHLRSGSIRPSSEQITQVSAGLRVAGSQVRINAMSLKDYIGMAYSVRPQQIQGPDWLGQERFDLAATIPSGGSAAQLPEMLRALLADRFKMTMHR